MSSGVGDGGPELNVAIIGAGPSGFYAAEGLLKQESPRIRVDLFDRLPTPYGLVRGGVAPDHQKIKSVIKIYERTAARQGFRFFGNVGFGRDIFLEDLLACYQQVLFCTGAESDRRMGIPGEDLPGSHPATEFVGWYNGHPEYTHHQFDLSAQRVAVIGNGNVAVDVTRVLARTVEELAATDIADYALEALRHSQVREILVLGRRGPAQSAFTNPEIRELGNLTGVDLVVSPEEMILDEGTQAWLAAQTSPTNRRNVEILREQSKKGEGGQNRKIHMRFLASPVEVLGSKRVEGLKVERNRLEPDQSGQLRPHGTGEYEEMPVDLVFRSIGYKGTALPGLPFDARSGIIPNKEGRVLNEAGGSPLARLYVAGWIKRGPSGVIGTNKADALATVRHMLSDWRAEPISLQADGPDKLFRDGILQDRGCRPVSYAQWKQLDALELSRGQAQGRPRVKMVSVDEMLRALD